MRLPINHPDKSNETEQSPIRVEDLHQSPNIDDQIQLLQMMRDGESLV